MCQESPRPPPSLKILEEDSETQHIIVLSYCLLQQNDAKRNQQGKRHVRENPEEIRCMLARVLSQRGHTGCT